MFKWFSRTMLFLLATVVMVCSCLGGYLLTSATLFFGDTRVASNPPANPTAPTRTVGAQATLTPTVSVRATNVVTPLPAATATPLPPATLVAVATLRTTAAPIQSLAPSPLPSTPTAPPPTASPTSSPTPLPTATPFIELPTATPLPPVAQVRCKVNIAQQSTFYRLWSKYQTQLGCAQSEMPFNPEGYRLNEQLFESGHMFFVSSGPVNVVIVKLGTVRPSETGQGAWQIYQSRPWTARDENFCNEGDGLDRPIYDNFNVVWCGQASLRRQLGNPRDFDANTRAKATTSDTIKFMLAQTFERGFILRDTDGAARQLAYVFLDNGTYTREPY